MTGSGLLPDGRVVISAWIGGRERLMVTGQGLEPVRFVQSQEETRAPFCSIGRDKVAFLMGRPPATSIALAWSSDGRIIRPISDINADTIVSMAGSPDGKTIYYVDGGTVHSIPAEGGAPQELCAGDAVAVNPAGQYLLVSRNEPEGARLVWVSLPEFQEKSLPGASDFRMSWRLSPGAIAKYGRIALQGTSSGYWYWQVRILDPRTGKLERVMEGIPADLQGPSWDGDGRLVVMAEFVKSSLWCFRPDTP